MCCTATPHSVQTRCLSCHCPNSRSAQVVHTSVLYRMPILSALMMLVLTTHCFQSCLRLVQLVLSPSISISVHIDSTPAQHVLPPELLGAAASPAPSSSMSNMPTQQCTMTSGTCCLCMSDLVHLQPTTTSHPLMSAGMPHSSYAVN
jgi:hypothetical protein